MRKNSDAIYAVITGDIVGFSKRKPEERRALLRDLKAGFTLIDAALPDAVCAPFSVYRGDSFQGVLVRAGEALQAAILLRAEVRRRQGSMRHQVDVRTAIGIGRVDYLPGRKAAEGDGEAFRRSGPALDGLRGDQRTVVRTPWPEVDAELRVGCALLDAVVNRWSPEQAEAASDRIRGMTQTAIAEGLGISQPAVRDRLQRAGAWAIIELCERYQILIDEERGSRAYE